MYRCGRIWGRLMLLQIYVVLHMLPLELLQ